MHAVSRQAAILCVCAALAAGCAAADEQQQTKAVFDTGIAAYDAKDYAKAFRIFSSIDDSDLAAMRNVALMLRKGQGTAKDPKAAEKMYQRAAEGGLATAAADLGEMLLNGEAGAPDAKAAAPWLAGAAGAGHPIAAFELGRMFETGNGVPKDLAAARKLYEVAAKGGMDEAKTRLDALPPTPSASHKP
jgi:uncharacterized protein